MQSSYQLGFGYQAIATKVSAMDALHTHGQTLENFNTGETLTYDREAQSYMLGAQPISEQQAQDFLSRSLPGRLMAHVIVPTQPVQMPNLNGYTD